MRILVANDGVRDGGGVQSYLDSVVAGIRHIGHDVAFLHYDRRPRAGLPESLESIPSFGVLDEGLDRALAGTNAWAPDVCFSHNMGRLEVERALVRCYPVVKFMHGYFGTCIGGQKVHLFPRAEPCERRFGAACLALYLPRRCGQMNLGKFVDQYRWAREQQSLFPKYRAIIVASEHMKSEYVGNGIDEARVHVLPLFPTSEPLTDAEYSRSEGMLRVLFLSRMTSLKGGDVLIRAAAEAVRRTGGNIHLTMCGDGPFRSSWERLAFDLDVPATFTGWVEGADRNRAFLNADVLAVPSVWPEPFGLVGLEAGQAGVPAVAFDVGGIREWLRDGVNGVFVPATPPDYLKMAAALERMLSHPEDLLALRTGARQVASEMSLRAHIGSLDPILAAAAR